MGDESRDPSSARLVSEVEGNWSVADWSPDDSELLVVNSPAANTQTSLWRVNVKSGQRTQISPRESAVWRAPVYSPDGRYVYVLSNRDSETLRLWRGELRHANVEADYRGDRRSGVFRAFSDGRTIAAVFDSTTSSRVELLDASTFNVRWAPKLPAGQLTHRDRCGGPTAARWRFRSRRCERSGTSFR